MGSALLVELHTRTYPLVRIHFPLGFNTNPGHGTVSPSRIGASGSQPPARNANPLQFDQSFQKPLQGKTSAKWHYSTSNRKPEPGQQTGNLLASGATVFLPVTQPGSHFPS